MSALFASSRLSTIPVVIMSGDNQSREKAERSGARGCLVKPIDLDVLLRTVHQFTSVTGDWCLVSVLVEHPPSSMAFRWSPSSTVDDYFEIGPPRRRHNPTCRLRPTTFAVRTERTAARAPPQDLVECYTLSSLEDLPALCSANAFGVLKTDQRLQR